MHYLDKQSHPSKGHFLNYYGDVNDSYPKTERKHVNLTISVDSSGLKINIQKNLPADLKVARYNLGLRPTPTNPFLEEMSLLVQFYHILLFIAHYPVPSYHYQNIHR
jgi:hypothetical protein